MGIEVLLQRMHVGALKCALAGVVEQPPQSAVHKLGRTRLRRVTGAGRRTRRVADRTLLCATDAPGRSRQRSPWPPWHCHGALVRQEIQEPHKLTMQAAGGRRDQGQESLSILQVVEAVVLHLALGSVDEGAIGVLSMPKRSVATDVITGAVERMDHGDVDDQVSLVSDVCIFVLLKTRPVPASA